MTQAVSIRSISADALKCAGGTAIPERLGDIKPREWKADAATVARIHRLGRDVVDLHCDFATLSAQDIKRTVRRFIAETDALLDILTAAADRRRIESAVRFRLVAIHNCFEGSSANMQLRRLADIATYLAPVPCGQA